MCQYYNSIGNGRNAEFGTAGSIPNLISYTFIAGPYGSGGAGQGVKNNAGSGWNRDTNHAARVYFNSGYGGASDYFWLS